MNKDVLAVIIGRAGSKGLPGKNERAPAGVPMVAHTIEHAKAARRVSRIVVSTDGPVIAAAARAEGIEIVDRPPRLASDSASVADVVRHAAARVRTEYDVVVVLYANVPVRPADLIDAAVDMLLSLIHI